MEMNIKVVIPSRKRPKSASVAASLFTDCVVCVAESERGDYSAFGQNLVTHPDSVIGIGPIRQWILDNFSDDIIFMVDDDVTHVWCHTGLTGYRIADPATIMQVIGNAANITCDLGLHLFGFAQYWDVRKYKPSDPFLLNMWFGGAIGFIGRDPRMRYSANLLRADIDYCLQSLLHYRIVFQESRFAFVHQRFGATGGNSANRSAGRDNSEIDGILRKWKKYVCLSDRNQTRYLKIDVPRKQTITIKE